MKKDTLGDWRIAAVTTLAQDVPAAFPGGPAHKAGAPVYQGSLTRDPLHNVIGFITPSPTALALNVAMKNASKAKALRETLALNNTLTPWGSGESVVNENVPHLFDFFEHTMTAVFASFQSLEVFSNEVISKELRGTFDLVRSKETLKLSGEELERRASTDEKLGDVLPS